VLCGIFRVIEFLERIDRAPSASGNFPSSAPFIYFCRGPDRTEPYVVRLSVHRSRARLMPVSIENCWLEREEEVKDVGLIEGLI